MADYLTDEEQAERLKQWWDKNGTSLVVGLILAVGAVVGWRYYQGYVADRADAAAAVFTAYLDERNAGSPSGDALRTIDDDYTGSAYHIFALLYRAADQAEEKDWEETLALLERAIELANADMLRDIARYRAAKVLYQLDRLDDSEAQLAQIRSVGLAAPVSELAGDLAVARGDLAGAEQAYRAAVETARSDPANIAPGLAFMELKLASLVDNEQ